MQFKNWYSRISLDENEVVRKPRLLSDNGPCYISKNLQEYIKAHRMDHTRGRPFHPMTQGQTLSSVNEKHHSPGQLLSTYGTRSSDCTGGGLLQQQTLPRVFGKHYSPGQVAGKGG